MRVHIADTSRSAKWRPYDVDWETFVEEKLRNPIQTSETFEIYKTLDKDEKQLYKDVGGYVFGTLQKDSRKKSNVISRNALLLDMDFAPIDVYGELKSKFDFEFVLHTTHSHETSAPRWRLIIPLDRDCTPDEYECVARTVAYNLNMEYFDSTTFQRNRMMYFPSVAIGGEWVFEWQKGERLDVNLWLSVYEDWRDITSWAFHSKEKPLHENSGVLRTDPLELDGIIGAFNRTFTVEDVLETFLSDLYKKEIADRYTYLQGSSAMGAVVYENKWFYSYHATDPSQGRLLSAFELVMCHLFNDDLKEAVKYASELPQVRQTAVASNFVSFGEGDSTSVADVELEEWYASLEIDKSGKVLPTDRNIKLIFENDKNLKDVFHYNAFVNNIYVMKPTLWRKKLPPNGDIIRNEDIPNLRTYFGLRYGITNRVMIEEMLFTIAYEKSYHPIQDYLASLTWDGEERLSTTLQDYFGAEDNVYTREVFKRTLIGAVKRVFNYGHKHDTALILVGGEGTAKSQFINRLGKSWFSDTFDLHNDKAAYEQLQGKWIIEIGEIDRMNRNEVGQVKNFITKVSDTYRPAFGRVVEDFNRQCIFFGTTNEDEFLKSETGNRRFCPVRVNNGKWERNGHISKKYVYENNVKPYMSEYEVDMMWAEAFHYALMGEQNHLSMEASNYIDSTRDEFEETSALSGEIDNALLTLVPDNYEDLTEEEAIQFWALPEIRPEGTMFIEQVCGLQLWVEVLGRSRESYGRIQQLEMLSAIRKSKVIDGSTSVRGYSKRYGRQRLFKLKI